MSEEGNDFDDFEDLDFEEIESYLETSRIMRQSSFVERVNYVLVIIMGALKDARPVSEPERRLYRGLWHAARLIVDTHGYIDSQEKTKLRAKLEEYRQKWDRQ